MHFIGHISILRKEIEGIIEGYFFVDGVNDNLRKRLKDDWLRLWEENKRHF